MARERLDLPRSGRTFPRPTVDPDAFGRSAESIARFIGTGKFLVYMTIFIVVWVLWNSVGPGDAQFDMFPFIFLTLMLSVQASYSAPLILLAQNRQDDRDRVSQEQDRQVAARSRADMDYLAREIAALRIAMGEVATRDYLRTELRDLLDELRAEVGSPEDDVHARHDTDSHV